MVFSRIYFYLCLFFEHFLLLVKIFLVGIFHRKIISPEVIPTPPLFFAMIFSHCILFLMNMSLVTISIITIFLWERFKLEFFLMCIFHSRCFD